MNTERKDVYSRITSQTPAWSRASASPSTPPDGSPGRCVMQCAVCAAESTAAGCR